MQRQTVSLLTVLRCQHQHLICAAVIKAYAIGDNVVYLGIAGDCNNLVQLQRLYRIRTAPVLLFPQTIFYKVLPGNGASRKKLIQLFHQAFIFRTVIPHRLVQLAALLEVLIHLSCQLQMDTDRTFALLADDRIDDLDCLCHCTAHHRACNILR